jgi:hypothetical protein
MVRSCCASSGSRIFHKFMLLIGDHIRPKVWRDEVSLLNLKHDRILAAIPIKDARMQGLHSELMEECSLFRDVFRKISGCESALLHDVCGVLLAFWEIPMGWLSFTSNLPRFRCVCQHLHVEKRCPPPPQRGWSLRWSMPKVYRTLLHIFDSICSSRPWPQILTESI